MMDDCYAAPEKIADFEFILGFLLPVRYLYLVGGKTLLYLPSINT